MLKKLSLLLFVTACSGEQNQNQQSDQPTPQQGSVENQAQAPQAQTPQPSTIPAPTPNASSALGQLPTTGKEIVTINNQKITEDVIDALLSNLPEEKREEVKSNNLDKIKEQLIKTELLYQAAVEDKLFEDPKVQTAMIMAQRQVLATTVLQKRAEAKLSDESLQKAYNDQLPRFQNTEADIDMIMVKEEALAKDIHAKVSAGGDFAALAKEHGINPQAKDGGKMGKLPTKKLPPQAKKSVETAKENTLLAPMQLGRSWGIIRVNSVDTKFKPFEEVKEELKVGLVRQYSDEVISELTSAASIVDHTPTEKKTTAPALKLPPEGKRTTPKLKVPPTVKTTAPTAKPTPKGKTK